MIDLWVYAQNCEYEGMGGRMIYPLRDLIGDLMSFPELWE
jgi:hypothetical protein